MVRLSDDDPEERQRAHDEFAAWKARDPRHCEAAAVMERLLARSQQLREDLHAGSARQALARVCAGKPRTSFSVPLLVLLFLACSCLAVLQSDFGNRGRAYLLADLQTDTGEWRTVTLTDGSRLELASGSAVQIDYSDLQRRIRLLRGEVLFEVAHDHDRPFVVVTAYGSIRALGTRFHVLREDDATLLTMLESRVLVQAGDGPRDTMTVAAGDHVRIADNGISHLPPVDTASAEQAWRQHVLVAQARPLPEVLEQIARNRPGLLLFERAQLAAIQVSAVLPLDDSDRALQLLANNFPQLRIRHTGSYLVRIDLQTNSTH
jgi:transmembrane sensor